jgi:Rrf2 family protein
MKVSTRGEYGMRAMVSLARMYGQGPMPLSAVASDSNVPPAYLEQLMGPLRRAGLVTTTRGAHGGYQLSRPPEDVFVGQVYRIMEGPIAPMSCVTEDTEEDLCPMIDGCATRSVWLKVRDSIAEALDSTTLADLLRKPSRSAPHGSTDGADQDSDLSRAQVPEPARAG